MLKDNRIDVGSVVQITSAHNQLRGSNGTKGRSGWVGALVIVTEVKSWGVVGYVHVINTHDSSGKQFIQLSEDEICYVGEQALEFLSEAYKKGTQGASV